MGQQVLTALNASLVYYFLQDNVLLVTIQIALFVILHLFVLNVFLNMVLIMMSVFIVSQTVFNVQQVIIAYNVQQVIFWLMENVLSVCLDVECVIKVITFNVFSVIKGITIIVIHVQNALQDVKLVQLPQIAKLVKQDII